MSIRPVLNYFKNEFGIEFIKDDEYNNALVKDISPSYQYYNYHQQNVYMWLYDRLNGYFDFEYRFPPEKTFRRCKWIPYNFDHKELQEYILEALRKEDKDLL